MIEEEEPPMPGGRDDEDPEQDEEPDGGQAAEGKPRPVSGGLAQRLRNLSPAAQHKLAREGSVEERLVLERMYGKQVWEILLRNPRLTPREVAAIAKKGSLPRPLVAEIASHPEWLAHGIVRRALFTNPRLGGDALMKVIMATPPPERKLIPRQTAYPLAVRELARKLLDRG